MSRRGWYTLPGMALAGYGWAQVREPGRWAGLGVALALGLAVWPVLVLAVVFGLPALAQLAIPRSWRRKYRHRYERNTQKSARIPKWLRAVVLAMDRHRCAHCGIRAALQIDHIMPWSLGGMTSLWNLAALCRDCNLAKSNYWRYRDGYVVYRAWEGCDVPARAAAILATEKRARWNLARWWRAAWALG